MFGLSFVSTCGDDRLNNSFSLNTRYTFKVSMRRALASCLRTTSTLDSDEVRTTA